MKHILFSLLSLIILFVFPANVLAKFDPRDVPNNIYGIHIENPSDLTDAANLVNGSGGDWGYVTIVITSAQKNDRVHWQKFLDDARLKHIIPIFRVATAAKGDSWEIPRVDEIDSWISFFDSLNWVIENRYIIIGNEPNHAKEWGNTLSPEEYAVYLKEFSKRLKATSTDYFILPAALDLTAPNSRETMDAEVYLKRMVTEVPDLLNFIDGVNSHSYPNPGFVGSEYAVGRKSIKGYEWELTLLNSLGMTRDLPVFITETGWIHEAGNLETKFSYAFESVWAKDKRVVAVTPFILNYTHPPFDTFTWKKADGSFTDFYTKVASLPKVKGKPKQYSKGEIILKFVSPVGLTGETLKGIILAKNTGQTIWSSGNLQLVQLEGTDISISNITHPMLLPFKTGLITFDGTFPDSPGTSSVKLALTVDENKVTDDLNFQVTSIDRESYEKQNLITKILTKLEGLIFNLKQIFN